jgi:hypothetical protein
MHAAMTANELTGDGGSGRRWRNRVRSGARGIGGGAGRVRRGPYLGDAIRFFLDAKHAGGRSERTLSEYRKKLDLFQSWASGCLSRENDTGDSPVSSVGS